MCWCVFLKRPATTKIYTDWHTLSYTTHFRPHRRSAAARHQHRADGPRGPDETRRAGRAGGNHLWRSAGDARLLAAAGRGCKGLHRRQDADGRRRRSEEHTSELQSLMRISYAVFCLKKKTEQTQITNTKN